MADGSKIEWTDATWNPIRARNRETGGTGHYCVHVSEGCRNCYAERMQPRFRNPVRYAAQDREKVELFLDRKTLEQPLRWREPRMVFVCSMTDLFLEDHTDEWIDSVFAVMALCPQHTFQVLTKRPERMRSYMEGAEDRIRSETYDDIPPYDAAPEWWERTARNEYRLRLNWPLPNVWLGVSIEDQETANGRIPILLETPSAVRFVSAEPLLARVDLRRWMNDWGCERCGYGGSHTDDHCSECGWVGDSGPAEYAPCPDCGEPLSDYYACPKCGATNETGFGVTITGRTLGQVDWIICGGESGLGGRPMHPDWARSLKRQCQAAGVPFFMKQMARKAPIPSDLLVREWPVLKMVMPQ